MRTYVWRLRSLLADGASENLITEPSSYLLRVAPGELDLAEFERLLREGRAALSQCQHAEAARLLRAGLGLWRDEPFADVSLHSPGLAAEVHRLGEARVAALEDRIECDLALGQHAALIGDLENLSVSHPLRERIAGQLMLACYRANRQADALATYRRLRTRLALELGVEPSHDLRDLNERILRADLGLLARRSASQGDSLVVPRQLPLSPAHFVGRAAELKSLTEMIDRAAAGQSGIAVISAIDGAAGIGKTALAALALIPLAVFTAGLFWLRRHERFLSALSAK